MTSSMRLRVQVGKDWTVRLGDAASRAPWIDPATGASPTRTLGRLPASSGLAVPAPAEGRTAPPDGSKQPELWTGDTGDPHEAILQHVVDRDPQPGETESLGRYLHQTLFGDAVWSAVRAALPADARLDLVLAFDADAALSRWPWEMMRDRDTFLAAQPRLSIIREVSRTADPLTEVERTPRVLFIVGTTIHDKEIKPAAEYLHLLRGLRAGNLYLETCLIARATMASVQAAVTDMRPDVVHFICHGVIDDNQSPSLELVHPTDPARMQPISADGLELILRGVDGRIALPRFVVLSACHSAGSAMLTSVGDLATPLAESLVRAGVPVVIGMAGSIADQACRLFTRQFYESVARGGDAAEATALGRQAAIAGGGTDPRSSVDWALPAIYVASGVGPPYLGVHPGQTVRERLTRWRKPVTMNAFGARPVFCGRLDVLERFDLLMASIEVQPSLRRLEDRIVSTLTIDVQIEDEHKKHDRFGRTWLLKELAERALAAGHVPILVARAGQSARTRDELIDQIENAAMQLADLWDLPVTPLVHVRAVQAAARGEAADGDLEPNFRPFLAAKPQPSTYGRALRLDLLRLLTLARQSFWPEDGARRCRLVLIVDDLHKMDAACDTLLHELIGNQGVGVAGDHIRTVLGWSSLGAQTSTVKAIEAWLVDKPEDGKIAIKAFGYAGGKIEEELAYRYYLLHQRIDRFKWPGLVVRPSHDENERFWKLMSTILKGVPSRFADQIPDVVEGFLEDENAGDQLFRPADDEDRLAAARTPPR